MTLNTANNIFMNSATCNHLLVSTILEKAQLHMSLMFELILNSVSLLNIIPNSVQALWRLGCLEVITVSLRSPHTTQPL